MTDDPVGEVADVLVGREGIALNYRVNETIEGLRIVFPTTLNLGVLPGDDDHGPCVALIIDDVHIAFALPTIYARTLAKGLLDTVTLIEAEQ